MLCLIIVACYCCLLLLLVVAAAGGGGGIELKPRLGLQLLRSHSLARTVAVVTHLSSPLLLLSLSPPPPSRPRVSFISL